jgi:hypothetical protein
VPSAWLYISAVFIAIVVMILLVFIASSLIYRNRHSIRRKYLVSLYSDFISEVILCDSEEDLTKVIGQPQVQDIMGRWLTRPYGRRVLTDEIIKAHRNMTGVSAANLRWLFDYLNLQNEALQKLTSKKWHLKVSGIQQLAEMKKEKYISRIYRETNSKNHYVRTEAQIAVVKLTGFDGLRFLNVISQPVTQWQQLCLLEQLSLQSSFNEEKVVVWLQSKNETVIEFALKLVEYYKSGTLYSSVISCLDHRSTSVRVQVIQTLGEIYQDDTASFLEGCYYWMEKEARLKTLEVLRQIGTDQQIPFLTSLLQEEDETILINVIKALQALHPNWKEFILKCREPKQAIPATLDRILKLEAV